MNVVIIIPTFNEKGNIEKVIDILEEKIFPQIKNHTMNILVVDDKSPDKTAGAVKNLQKKWKNLELNECEKNGLEIFYGF